MVRDLPDLGAEVTSRLPLPLPETSVTARRIVIARLSQSTSPQSRPQISERRSPANSPSIQAALNRG